MTNYRMSNHYNRFGKKRPKTAMIARKPRKIHEKYRGSKLAPMV